MTSLGKGDAIECIQGHDDPALIEGHIYTVEAVDPFDTAICTLHGSPDCYGVRTTFPKLQRNLFWCAKRFKPVFKFKEGQFDYLKESNPVCEEV